MQTAIKIWEISDQQLKPVEDSNLSVAHVESELETWICRNPELLGDRLLIIDRQRDIPGVGRLDLLGIDQGGKLVIIELKRDHTPPEAVAQALDYASWLDSATEDEIEAHAEQYLERPLGQERMVFGVNIAGKNNPPAGQLDIWIPTKSLAESTGVPDAEIRHTLRGTSLIFDQQNVDCWIRLRKTEDAQVLVGILQNWVQNQVVAASA